MRVVITGGSGLIGRALASELVERGDQVVVTTRSPEGVDGLPDTVEVAAWDTESSALVEAAIGDADAVVHLVGEGIGDGRWTASRRRRIRESRVRSTAVLAQALERLGGRPATLIQGSAVGYYGSRGDERLTEASDAGDGFLADVCKEWEEAAAGVEEAGIRRAILRTGVVLSSEGGALPRMALPFKLFAGGPVGGGDQWVPWIHIADEVGAILHLLDRSEARGPFNLTAPEEITNRELSKAIGRALHRPSFLPAPAFALKIALGDMSRLLLDSQRVAPEALATSGYAFEHPRIEAALADLLA